MAGTHSDQPKCHKAVQGGGKCIVLRGRCESERDGTAAEVFPHAEWVSREYGGVPVPNLVEILRLEREFHRRILETDSLEERREQYRELYDRVHILKQQDVGVGEDPGSFDRLVLTFRKELEGRSVLDVGCGSGLFLTRLAQILPHGELWGLDTSDVTGAAHAQRPFQFFRRDVTTFTLPRQFEVVFSHQVFEHIAPPDVPAHLTSIREALVPGGEFIVCLPNRYWGPQDITRIVDNTFRGRVAAQGSHLNESSYTEMTQLLERFGFVGMRTVVPFGAFIPMLRGVRVRPRINMLLERSAALRGLNNVVARRGRPLFKNPIMLVCRRG